MPILMGMCGERCLRLLSVGLGLALAGWTALRERVVLPDRTKSVAVLLSEAVRGRSDELTLRFRDLLVYELRQVPWFEVSDREMVEEDIARFHGDDPVRHLVSFHAVVWVGEGTNGGLRVAVHFPRTRQRPTVRTFVLRDVGGAVRAAALVRSNLAFRMPLSGDVLEVRGRRVVANLGASAGVGRGSYWVAFRSNLRPVAVLRVDRVHGLASEMTVTRWEEGVMEGDALMPAEPDILAHYASRRVVVDGRTNLTVATGRAVAGVVSRTMRVWFSPHDDAFVAWDGVTLLFFDPPRRRSVVLARGVWVDRVAWRPGTHTVAYGSGGDLWVHEAERGRRWRLVVEGETGPVFRPAETVFGVTNRHEVLDFVWDEHGGRSAFFLAGRGLFMAEGWPIRGAAKVVPGLHPESAMVRLAFGSEGDSLWAKAADLSGGAMTVFRLGLEDGGVKVWRGCVPHARFVVPPDGDGVLELRVDDEGRTNLWRLSGWGEALLRTNQAAMPSFAAGMDAGLVVGGRRLRVWRNGGALRDAGWRIVREAFFFPATSRVVVSGFVADSNRDGVVDWKDDGEVFVARPTDGRKGERLVGHCEEFYGFTATGRYLVYRRGDRLYWAEVGGQGSVLMREPVAGSRTR